MVMPPLYSRALCAAVRAGVAILSVRRRRFTVHSKDDRSPVTEADHAAHRLIADALRDTEVPLVSEEGRSIALEARMAWTRLWVVDPLDGTKGFVAGSDDFTVNIALVTDGMPEWGVVYLPVSGMVYAGGPGTGSIRMQVPPVLTQEPQRPVVRDEAMEDALTDLAARAERLPPVADGDKAHGEAETDGAARVRVVASKSHRNAETEAYIERLEEIYGPIELVAVSSSKKLCAVAEGSADIYPRLGRTMEWDVAAGDAVVRGAGGRVVSAADGTDLVYNKADLASPYFVAVRAGFPVPA